MNVPFYPFSQRWSPLIFFLYIYSQTAWGAPNNEQIRILSTNDLHSYLRPLYYKFFDETKPWAFQPKEGNHDNKTDLVEKIGGIANVATVIKRLRAEKPGKTLLVDAGDTWHGAGISLFDKGVSVVKIMNTIGYDFMALGNWDFFYPKEHLLDLLDQAKFPVLAYNLTDKEWEEPVLEQQYVIKQVGKLTIAIVGMTYPWTALTSSMTGSAKWWRFGIKEEEAKELIKKIRQNVNPDLLVFVSHGGWGLDQKFAKRVDGIDVIVSGHTHDAIFNPAVWNNTIIFQAGAHGKYVASIDLEVKDKKVVNFDYRLVLVNQKQDPADPEIDKIVDEAYRPYQNKMNEVIGETKTILYRRGYYQSPMGNLITAVLRDAAKTDIALFPSWRYGATILPGKIRAEDIYNIIPTNGHILTYSMRGKEIKMLLENILESVVDSDPYTRVGGDMIRFSGMKLRYDLKKPKNKIVSMTIGGNLVSPDKLYTIASAHTRFQNNPLFGALYIKDTNKIFVEELIKYIRKNSPISFSTDDRIMPEK